MNALQNQQAFLRDIIGESGVKDVEVARWTLHKDFPVLWIIINAEAVETKDKTFGFLATAEQFSDVLLLFRQLVSGNGL